MSSVSQIMRELVGCRMLEDNKAIYDYVNQNYHGE